MREHEGQHKKGETESFENQKKKSEAKSEGKRVRKREE